MVAKAKLRTCMTGMTVLLSEHYAAVMVCIVGIVREVGSAAVLCRFVRDAPECLLC